MGHRQRIGGPRGHQVRQTGIQTLGQLLDFLRHQARYQEGEVTTPAARHQLARPLPRCHLAEQLGHRQQQLVGALAAQALIESGEIVQAQQEQVTGAGLFPGAEARLQLHFEVTAVGQPGQAVLVGLVAQPFAAFGLFLEQRLELLHHLVHRLHHTAQFGGARQFRQAEELAAGDGVGLLHHVIQGSQLAP
ncbi:hypothetical protein D9M71_45610 [compost metagenome]